MTRTNIYLLIYIEEKMKLKARLLPCLLTILFSTYPRSSFMHLNMLPGLMSLCTILSFDKYCKALAVNTY